MRQANKMTNFLKNNWKQLLLIIVIFALLGAFCFSSHFIRLAVAIRSCWRSFLYYLRAVFSNGDATLIKPEVSFDYLLAKAGGNIFNLLPFDIGKFGHHLMIMVKLLSNATFWNEWFNKFSNAITIITLVINILIYFYLFAVLLKIFRKYKNNSLPEDTTALTRFKNFVNKIKPTFNNAVSAIKKYFKLYLVVTLIIFAAFYFQLFTILFDIIANYYYFLAEFDASILWKGFLINLVDFIPRFVQIPLLIRIAIIYFILDKIRLKKAVNGIKDKEEKTVEFLENAGNEIFINGGSRAGKNALAVTFAVCYVQLLFPRMSLSSMLEIQRKFPFVNYNKLREFVESQKYLKKIKTQLDIYKLMALKEKEFATTKDKSIYFIDDNNVAISKWDELTIENVNHAITDYMIIYFMYISEKPRSVSNYTIMFNDGINEKQHYLNVSHLDPADEKESDFKKRKFNVVINYDYMRLGHRFSSYSPEEYYVPDVGLYSITEIGKERGDTDSVKKADGSSLNVNQKNDKFTERLKIWSHAATIRFKTFFKFIADEQRNVGLNANTRSTFETIILLDKRKMKKKSTLKLWKIEEFLCRLILSKYDEYSLARDEIKRSNSLPNYFIKKIVEKLNMYYYRRINKFTYTECNVYSQNGTVEGVNNDVESKKVFIINKLSYSGRYETTSMKKLFLDDMTKSKMSFDEREQFKSLTPSPLNWQSMRSFSAQDLFGFKYDK